MVFIGFGFLMTYLRRYSLGAIMLNFLGSCLMFLVAILIVGAAQQRPENTAAQAIDLEVCRGWHSLQRKFASTRAHLFLPPPLKLFVIATSDTGQ
eukprot:1158868-Pelagomonas_calceolata.AAC.6